MPSWSSRCLWVNCFDLIFDSWRTFLCLYEVEHATVPARRFIFRSCIFRAPASEARCWCSKNEQVARVRERPCADAVRQGVRCFGARGGDRQSPRSETTHWPTAQTVNGVYATMYNVCVRGRGNYKQRWGVDSISTQPLALYIRYCYRPVIFNCKKDLSRCAVKMGHKPTGRSTWR